MSMSVDDFSFLFMGYNADLTQESKSGKVILKFGNTLDQ